MVPDEWEMLGYSTEFYKGRCWIADRYSERLEFSWQHVKTTPDIARMASQYRARMVDEDILEDVRGRRIGNWRGLVGEKEQLTVSRYIKHMPAEKVIAELVFHWPGQRDEKLEERVCSSMREEPLVEALGARLQHWRAFGMNMYPSENYGITAMAVQPAMTRMSFGPRKRYASIFEDHFQRLGMVSRWLQGSVDDWLALKTPVYVSKQKTGRREHAGHAIATVSGQAQKTNFVPFKREKGRYHAAAWICPHDHRLYYGYRVAPENDKGPADIAGRRLSCCADVGRLA